MGFVTKKWEKIFNDMVSLGYSRSESAEVANIVIDEMIWEAQTGNI